MEAIEVTYFSDPGCPWAYSVNPALAVLRWRYGEQLDWRLVTIGLTESGADYEARGYTPELVVAGYAYFRRYGMPFGSEPRPRMVATARACRALVAVRLLAPGREWEALRALQFAWFTTPGVLDEDPALEAALADVEGVDAGAVLAALDSAEVERAYQADRAEARTAEGSPTEFQGKAKVTDGPVRYTAPSLMFALGGRRLEAGGFQTIEAYDVLVANLAPTLARESAPLGPAEVLERFPEGLVTQEVAAILADGNEAPDAEAARTALADLEMAGRARRTPLGDDALWAPA